MPTKISVDKTLSQARQAVKKQDWVTAVQLLRSVLDRFPANKKAARALGDIRVTALQALLELAKSAQGNEDWRLAKAQLEAAHYLAPDLVEVRTALIECCLEAKFPKQALGLIKPVLDQNPEYAPYLVYQGRALHELNQADAAKQSLKRVLATAPDDVSAHRVLATVERSQGDLISAQKHFEAGLKSAPWDVGIIRDLSALRSEFSPDDPVIAQARQSLAKLGSESVRGAYLHFALFDMLKKAGEREAAFEHLIKGNKILAAHHPYDFKSEALAGAFCKAQFSEPLQTKTEKVETKFIFITGLPRTGTTLAERILARSDEVQAAGELNIISTAVLEKLRSIRDRSNQRITDKDIASLRERILLEFDQISDGHPVIVDKMPLNFRWIGFICAALPEARIVHMNRDLHAVAWSLYRHAFQGRGHDFIYTPEDIARFMIFHRDMMQHWRQVCGDRIHDLNYSDLVNDQSAATRGLAKAVGLEWTEAFLSPEKATNHVRTSSVVQVTKPIYQGSDETWKTFEMQLEPLMKALETAKLI